MNMKTVYCNIVLGCLLIAGCATNGTPVSINLDKSSGSWNHEIVTQRKALTVTEADRHEKIDVVVPHSGNYQLLAYVHHDWRTYSPFIYAEAIDAEGTKHLGYHGVENIWYLDHKAPGRWFFVTLSDNPYWVLPKGKLSLQFWVRGNISCWDDHESLFENTVAISRCYLIPVGMEGMQGVINPEVGEGEWTISNYDVDSACNLIWSNNSGDNVNQPITIIEDGEYVFTIEYLSYNNNEIKIEITNNNDYTYQNTLKFRGCSTWNTAQMHKQYLKKGHYAITIEHNSENEIRIDYLLCYRL